MNGLKKGVWYRYDAGMDPVLIKFVKETIDGYLFTFESGIEGELHRLSVEEYIEEIES